MTESGYFKLVNYNNLFYVGWLQLESQIVVLNFITLDLEYE